MSNQQVKRIQYHRYGAAEEMQIEPFSLPSLKSGEILVRVKAAAANPADWKIRSGVMKLMSGKKFPRGVGNDFAGIIDAVGAGVTRFKLGDAVVGGADFLKAGAFGQALIAPEKGVVLKPPSLSFEQAAALVMPGVTAWTALITKGKLKSGQSVFINGCMGAVGQAATQIALAHGARIAGSCGAGSTQKARQMGVDPIIGYHGTELAALQQRFDVVFDTVGTLSLRQATSLLRPGGSFLDINPTGGKVFWGLFTRGYKMVFAKVTAELLSKVVELAVGGKLTSIIDRTVPLEAAIPALIELERGTKKGKLVITV